MSKQQRRRGMVAAGLAGVAIMVFTATAGASPVRFDNPAGAGHFDWAVPPGDPPVGLSVILSAADQTGVPLEPASFYQNNYATYDQIVGGSVGDVEVGGNPAVFLQALDAGDPIPSGAPWDNAGYANYPGYSYGLPYDVPTYIGVKFDLGSGDQYGWIGVVFASADFTADAFAWGYETEVGVPIAAGVPEPGSLAFGALAVCRRRP